MASPFEHAAILTLDGLGEWVTATIGVGSHRQVRLLNEQRFPNSIGLVYAYITAHCGFRPNEDEHKVMGLARYGTPRYLDALTDLVEVHDDGSVSADARSFGWFASSPRSTRRFRLAFDGPPRQPGVALTAREADLAASVQRLTEEVLMRMAWAAHRETGESAVCLGGGVALNGVANGRPLREGPFEKVWVQPAPGDAGSAVGAALSYWHESLGMARRVDPCKDRMRGSFLGSSTPRGMIW